ncbi:DNA helicase [Tanacetum coccineum]
MWQRQRQKVTPTELADAAKIKLHVQAHFGERDNAVGISDIMPCRMDKEEKMRSRFSIQSLLNVNPQHYKQLKFTTEATIMEINASKGWYYRKCTACNKKVPEGSPNPQCSDHGPQQLANYGATFDDGTAVATITCFSPEAHTFLPDCNDVVKNAENKDKRQVPDALKQLENTKHIFQYHFGKGAKPVDPDFNLDVAFQPSPQPLLSLLAPDLATTPPPEIMQQTTSNRTVTETESKPCPMTKDSAERSHTSLEEPKKTAKRLDVGEGNEVDLKECPRSKLRKQCIKYLGPQERENYEYIIVEGKIMHLQTQLPLDTDNGEKWIFVTSASNRLYAGEKKKGKFHHSSFLAGGATLAAGRLDVDNGTLKVLSGLNLMRKASKQAL